jgi:quercetin dioxygenase-like cupin family protein
MSRRPQRGDMESEQSDRDLVMRLTDLVPPGEAHIRRVLLDELETRLPRDPQARVNIQLSELSPGGAAGWHVHNGVVYFLVIRGLVTLEFEGRSEHHRAGEVYTEPVGVVHRAVNPHPDLAATFVGFWVTAADRPHVTEVVAPRWEPVESVHPRLADVE